MNIKFKYTENLRTYLNGNGHATGSCDLLGWFGTLSDAELSEFGQMIRMATKGKPIEDVARFLAVAMPRQDAGMDQDVHCKKSLERFLVSAYSGIVLERKERLQLRGKHVHKPKGNSPCSCCSHE